MLDLRIPCGLFFLLIGALLCGLGVFSPGSAALTTANVNLYAGAAMLAFGGILLLLARRSRT
ncbi:MAG: hypothetical protein HYR60_05430 [Acidobacteria bacterium]|nr:hypothetical protein [Acidobacteriota bacterium]MBI3470246.1 hypothetical protein [Candidatus Solibacter usitatus]